MASDKKEEGNPAFITQTETYELENDVGRHTRNTELQSKGFREQLHEPQPSPYVHATERMSAIDTDTAAIHTLGKGITAGIALHDKYDEGPSIREYMDDVHEITKAHQERRITDEQYRTQMRIARNNAQNAYGDNPKAMAKLKEFWSGKEYGEFDQYEASRQAIANAYTKAFGIACSPNDLDFEEKALKVQEVAEREMARTKAMTELQIANSKETVGKLEFREKANTYYRTCLDSLGSYVAARLTNGKLPEVAELSGLMVAIDKAENDFNTFTSRYSDDSNIVSKRAGFNNIRDMVKSFASATTYAEKERYWKMIALELGVENARINRNKNEAEYNQYLSNIKKGVGDGTTNVDTAMDAVKASNGDKEAAARLSKSAARGEKGAGHAMISSSLYSLSDDQLQSVLSSATPPNWREANEYLDDYDRRILLERGRDVFDSMKRTLLKYGKEQFFDPNTNEMKPLNQLVYLDTITPNGIRILPIDGAPPAAKRYAMSVSKVFSNGLEAAACGNRTQCNWEQLSKDVGVITDMKNVLSPYIRIRNK